MKNVIALDGPAASGKSTIAREIARILNFANVSSGGFYRAITWLALESGADTKSPQAVAEVLAKAKLEYGFNDQGAVVFVNGIDPTPYLKDENINKNVSPVAQTPEVRDNINEGLRTLGNLRDCVIEGRDIGTIVFPDTKFKFYIDASPEVRAQRRQAEGGADEIAKRDKMDSTRALAPLIAAKDAIIVDSTHLTVQQVLAEICDHLRRLGLDVPQQ